MLNKITKNICANQKNQTKPTIKTPSTTIIEKLCTITWRNSTENQPAKTNKHWNCNWNYFGNQLVITPKKHPPKKHPKNRTTTPRRMSMFFFRLHNLQRAEENKRKKRVEQQRQQRQRRGAKVFKCVSDSTGHLTLAPSRLFERTPMSPSDSLDEIALQIPRWVVSGRPKGVNQCLWRNVLGTVIPSLVISWWYEIYRTTSRCIYQ